jgi:shikimate kinase
MNIALIGFMGTGKSAVGKLLAEMLGMIYVDSDEEITKFLGCNISDLFAELGEKRFREIEKDTVHRLARLDGAVISCGGGVANDPENVAILQKTSKIVLLTASPEEVLRRTSGDISRPLLNTDNRLTRIIEIMKVRNSSYLAAADQVIDTNNSTPKEVVNQVLKQLGANI